MLFRRSTRAIRRLLVVEDEPLLAFDNEYHLEQAGYEVVATVDNVGDALGVLENRLVDAILLDVNLAGERSGVEVARAAHERQVPVLFLAGSVPDEAQQFAIAALSKPYGQRDLVAAVGAMDAIIAGRTPVHLPGSVRLFA
jgi:two-component system, response regulator PdtaR